MPSPHAPRTRRASGEYLVFLVGEVRCGVDIAQVLEINRNMDLTRVFTAPAHVRGVINLRGQIVTIIDLAQRLGVEVEEAPVSPRNVVVDSRGEAIGLLVSDIDDIISAGAGALLPPPPHLPQGVAACTLGVLPAADNLVVILDVDRIAD